MDTDGSPPDALLRGFWYPALPSARLRRGRLKALRLLNVPLVVGRTAGGRAFALGSRCPHRGMPLWFGHLDGDLLECCYHGWRFDVDTGRCREIPSLAGSSAVPPKQAFTAVYACQESDGHVWVYVPALTSLDQTLPPAPSLPVFGRRYGLVHVSVPLQATFDHATIGLIDPAHSAYVHRSWWWREPRAVREKEKVFEAIPHGFRMRWHVPSGNSFPYRVLHAFGQTPATTIDFVLPSVRMEQIHCGRYWLSNRLMVTPETTDRCRLDFWAASNVLSWCRPLGLLLRLVVRRFLLQDQATMAKLSAGSDRDWPMMLFGGADQPAAWYLQLKKAWVDAQRNGRPARHPLAEPVTLRWRT